MAVLLFIFILGFCILLQYYLGCLLFSWDTNMDCADEQILNNNLLCIQKIEDKPSTKQWRSFLLFQKNYWALWAKSIRFFKKILARHRASDMRKKIVRVGIRFSITTVLTTVVTTLATTVVTILSHPCRVATVVTTIVMTVATTVVTISLYPRRVATVVTTVVMQ